MTYYERYQTNRVLASFFNYSQRYSASAELVHEMLLACVTRGCF